ncbi:conserved hypothetical protein [Paraburkholderia ribeironis]|uniref:Uncharacterized protein n=1 Tax=Paraburkholderia ribeironis TaxID=1247936 RepID=A0A1N7RSS4_9BURK|nr:hypothetical protein [Paraburkholderia ribeironis]SIT38174.1 conserved hypothetical protein [Paraburkholderia ribeironis]
MADDIAKNSLVHGYNSKYQFNGATGSATRYHAFPLEAKGARFAVGSFTYMKVAGTDVFDHQGHIVPQNWIAIVIKPLMQQMSDECKSLADVELFIARQGPNKAWLESTLRYGMTAVAGASAPRLQDLMFDFDTNPITGDLGNAESRVGNFFSIVTWNPVNICRAPADTTRADTTCGEKPVPGEALDKPVLEHLRRYVQNATLGVDAAWLAAAESLGAAAGNGGAPSDKSVTDYLIASCATLDSQIHRPKGFYAFKWVKDQARLIPSAASLT